MCPGAVTPSIVSSNSAYHIDPTRNVPSLIARGTSMGPCQNAITIRMVIVIQKAPIAIALLRGSLFLSIPKPEQSQLLHRRILSFTGIPVVANFSKTTTIIPIIFSNAIALHEGMTNPGLQIREQYRRNRLNNMNQIDGVLRGLATALRTVARRHPSIPTSAVKRCLCHHCTSGQQVCEGVV